MSKILSLIILSIILLVTCTDNEITVLDEKVFSLKLKDKWKKGYYKDSIFIEKSDERILFQTYYHQNKSDETEITNALSKLIEIYRKTEMDKSRDAIIGENHYGEINGVFVIRFIGNEKNNRYFSVFIFGTAGYLLSVYFEKPNTSEIEFETRAREIINDIALKQ